MLFGPQEQSDWSENDILGAIQKLVSGRTADLQDMHLSPDTHFYILGLGSERRASFRSLFLAGYLHKARQKRERPLRAFGDHPPGQ